jgi:YYY domain-containing protein
MDWLQWLLTVELLGIAALPLAAFLFRSFPDRGYGLAKPLGILLVAFVNWWLGSVVSLANYPLLIWAVTLVLAAAGASLYWFGLASRPEHYRDLGRIVAIEEAVFLVAFAGWSLVRGLRPDIFLTEKPMDFMLLQVSGASHSFPPPDAWLAGHTVNYYYLGYAASGMIGRMAGVDPRFGFNLSNVVIFALGCSAAYSLALATTKSRLWAFAGAFAVMLAGNLDTIPQVVAQLFTGGLNGEGLNLWCSTRIIDGGCDPYHSITEFPIFSLLWNDLHPHVMAIPFVLLAIGFGIQALKDPPTAVARTAMRYTWMAIAAVTLGMLFGVNSWDYPAYTIFVVLCVLVAAIRQGEPPFRALMETVAIIPLSLILYVPYFLTVHNPKSIGLQVNPTAMGDALTVIGGVLAPVAIFAVWRGALALAGSATKTGGTESVSARVLWSLPPGSGWWVIFGLVLIAFVWPARLDLVYVCVLAAIVFALIVRREREAPEIQAVLLLAFVGVAVLLASDFGYLRDNFDNSPNYRMNTVFKLYYQAWILLAVALPLSIRAIGAALGEARSHAMQAVWYGLALLLAAGTALYPIEGIGSQGPSQATSTPGLDGLAYARDIVPDEYRAIVWIQQHTKQFDVVAEADRDEYWGYCNLACDANVFSALTGRPTIIGWPGSHEALWRGDFGGGSGQDQAAALINQAEQDVRTLYTSADKKAAIQILEKYKVAYVVVGPYERTTFGTSTAGANLTKFASFLTPVLQLPAVTIYRVPCFSGCVLGQ